jgi:putative aldouronate transport system permease protein
MKQKAGDRIVDGIIILFIGIYAVTAILPFIYVIVASITPMAVLAKTRFIIIPKGFSLDSYRYLFSSRTIVRALEVSVFVTVVGTVWNIVMTVLFAYPLAHKTIKGRRIILFMVTFTIMFGGGLIPGYMLIRGLHLINSLGALIIPGAISTFNFVVFRNYFSGLPPELEESAMMDGAGYLRILTMIIIPISMPIIATFIIMYGVGHWNSWFSAVLYISDSTKWPIQVTLRMMMDLASGLGENSSSDSMIQVPPQGVRMATIVVSTLPILMIYPFFQKHFTKGMLLGSIKG